MTKDEALDLALEFVEANHSGGPDAFELITAIKQARSAPVQEPVTDAQKRAAFERFWVTEIGDKDDLTYGGLGYAINRVAVAWEAWKAATQRQWVGLTARDWNVIGFTAEFRAGAEWANDKLKEKNT